ncbi:hypothetical protein AM587_10003895 [Phytophthora nicotianae]|uniref:Uncharacterized protein n=1 Tax=Phytophthora nicotianae TaxID=4792 RepID=A0A0W8CK04_PHYNI|nr:hypothetical protein AM587_10003895 [Phytophthora nicotianae]
MSMRIATGEPYNNYIWLACEAINKQYTIVNDIVRLLTLAYRMQIIREQLDTHLTNDILTESMIPIIDGIPCPDSKAMDIINKLDPLLTECSDELDATNATINEHMPCCRLLAYSGTSDTPQILICLRTLMLFIRSRDNCGQTDRKCPFCVFARDESDRYTFGHADPWAGIPMYTYHSARKSKTNPEPLKFVSKYLTIGNALDESEKATPAKALVVLKPLRYSLFQSSTGVFSKTNIPNRAKFRGTLYASFYPPQNGLMHEENANWVLQRRLNCPLFAFMAEYIPSQYRDAKSKDKEAYAKKKDA